MTPARMRPATTTLVTFAVAVAVTLTMHPAGAVAKAPVPGTSALASAEAPLAAAAGAPAAERKKQQKKRLWRPRPGPTFNNPLTKDSHAINFQIRRAIQQAPKGSHVRLVTWNLKSVLYTADVIAAHRRGVSVRIVMSHGLAQEQSSQGSYNSIRRALAEGNLKRKPSMRSWIHTCKGACRGKGDRGILHSKFMLFDDVQTAKRVVMSTSANLTEVAANRQWNDLWTVVDDRRIYDNFVKTFNQLSRDTWSKPTFRMWGTADQTAWIYPRLGAPTDQVIGLLRPVRCKGAAGKAGKNGRTTIRVAQAVFNGQRGMVIARRLRQLHDRGCNVKIVYTVLTRGAAAVLAPVPKRHIVQDFDGDGAYDRYLHIKAFAISGNYDGDRTGYLAFNGSSNWSGMSTKSDEQGFIIRRQSATRAYTRWVDFLYKNPPPQRIVTQRVAPGAEPVDPYVNIRKMGL
jgi:phosphatidylserine/phosphatidylglycerophosphate/cardiolipin synthase-like enzyme